MGAYHPKCTISVVHLFQTTLLNDSMQRLMHMMSLPVDATNQHRDIKQVHAINIVKAVVSESSLTSSLRQYLAKLAVLALAGFTSKYWPIQNASIQLFGKLIAILAVLSRAEYIYPTLS